MGGRTGGGNRLPTPHSPLHRCGPHGWSKFVGRIVRVGGCGMFTAGWKEHMWGGDTGSLFFFCFSLGQGHSLGTRSAHTSATRLVRKSSRGRGHPSPVQGQPRGCRGLPRAAAGGAKTHDCIAQIARPHILDTPTAARGSPGSLCGRLGRVGWKPPTHPVPNNLCSPLGFSGALN